MAQTSVSILDQSGETSTFSLKHPDLNLGNIEAYTPGVPLNTYNRMMTAVDNLILGTRHQEIVTAVRAGRPKVLPGDVDAQRERKALVTYQDNVTLKFGRVEIPTFNMVGAQSGTDVLDLAVAAWVAFVSELEGGWTSDVGNAITVIEAKHVGRSL